MEYKNNKGLTLIEVLVSVVITILVMIYGVNLFIASWKLEVESAEYDMVLNYVANSIEYARSINESVELANLEAINPYSNKNIMLPTGRIVNIKARLYNNIDSADGAAVGIGAVPFAVTARWPYGNDDSVADVNTYVEHNEKVEIIAIDSYIGDNDIRVISN